ncbi:MAG: hypothetical protein WD491_06355 [Balneolales bacterium]
MAPNLDTVISSHREIGNTNKVESTTKRYYGVINAAASIFTLFLLAYFTIQLILNAGLLEKQIQNQVMKATGDLYFIEIENIDFSLTNRSFQASGISLRPNQPVLNALPQDSLPSYRYELDMSGFSLDGINLVSYLRDNKIEMSSLQLRNPVISLIINQELPGGNNQEEQQGLEPLHARLARQLPVIDVGDLSIDNATLAVEYRNNEERRKQIIEGLNLVFENIKVDSLAAQNENRVLFSDNVTLMLDGFQGESNDGIYQFDIGPVTASTRDSVFQIEDISVLPTVSDVEFVEMKEVLASRYFFLCDSIKAEEIDYRNLLDHQDVIIGSIEVNNYLLDMFTDLSLPKYSLSQLPHETVRDLDMVLNIQEVSLNMGQINYAEQADGGLRPGFIFLDSTYVHVQNMTNVPELMNADNPAIISVQTFVNGEGALEALIEMPLLDPDYPIYFSGEIGPVNAESLNSILVDLQGLNIQSGDVNSVIFDIQSTGSQATGTVRADYENLEIEVLEPRGYERDFAHELQSFIANNLFLRSSGETAREGDVENEFDPAQDTFVNYLIFSLVDGLISSLVILV